LLQRLQELKRRILPPRAASWPTSSCRIPSQAVFLKTRELAASCGVSEATVVRFVAQLGYGGYSDFIQELREVVDTELTLLETGWNWSARSGPGAETHGQGGQRGDRQPEELLSESWTWRRWPRTVELFHQKPPNMCDRLPPKLYLSPITWVGLSPRYAAIYRILRGSDSTSDRLAGHRAQAIVWW
jgi:hypothetical protein